MASVSDDREVPSPGARRRVAVVFADVVGFTPLAERLDPEVLTDFMNDCLEKLTAIVEQYGGHVDKYIGDCIMAVFGAVEAHENDAERAVRTAFALREAAREMTPPVEDAPTGQLQLSIGINHGPVVVATVGSGAQAQ